MEGRCKIWRDKVNVEGKMSLRTLHLLSKKKVKENIMKEYVQCFLEIVEQ